MNFRSISTSLLAHYLRLAPPPFQSYRARYRFYQRIKNSDLLLQGRIRHSRLTLPLNLGDWVQYWMFMDGAYEKQFVDILRPHITGKIFFDVGANVGNYTLALARSAARTYSFEASSSNAAILRNFVALSKLGNIEVVNKAVSHTSGNTISLYSSPDTGGNNTQFHDFGRGSEDVPTITLDQFAAENAIHHVDVIKMDIEGAELAALTGAHQLLSKSHPLLLVEFHAMTAKQANWDLLTLYNLLIDYGYSAHQVRDHRLVPFDSSSLSNPEFYANLIFKT